MISIWWITAAMVTSKCTEISLLHRKETCLHWIEWQIYLKAAPFLHIVLFLHLLSDSVMHSIYTVAYIATQYIHAHGCSQRSGLRDISLLVLCITVIFHLSTTMCNVIVYTHLFAHTIPTFISPVKVTKRTRLFVWPAVEPENVVIKSGMSAVCQLLSLFSEESNIIHLKDGERARERARGKERTGYMQAEVSSSKPERRNGWLSQSPWQPRQDQSPMQFEALMVWGLKAEEW